MLWIIAIAKQRRWSFTSKRPHSADSPSTTRFTNLLRRMFGIQLFFKKNKLAIGRMRNVYYPSNYRTFW